MRPSSDSGEVGQGVEAEDFQKSFGGSVEDGAAGFFGAAGDFDQMFFHQAADHFAACDAADGFDVGAGGWAACRR